MNVPGMSRCVTESPNSYLLGLLRFDGPFADDWALVPTAARRLQLAEQLVDQLRLKDAIRLGRHAILPFALLQPCCSAISRR